MSVIIQSASKALKRSHRAFVKEMEAKGIENPFSLRRYARALLSVGNEHNHAFARRWLLNKRLIGDRSAAGYLLGRNKEDRTP